MERPKDTPSQNQFYLVTSLQGLSVHLQCEGSYTPYPLSVKCRRGRGGGLEWSNLPVCFPTILVTPEHWARVPHAR